MYKVECLRIQLRLHHLLTVSMFIREISIKTTNKRPSMLNTRVEILHSKAVYLHLCHETLADQIQYNHPIPGNCQNR